VLEGRFQRSIGLGLGLGLGVLLAGGVGVLFSLQTYQNVARYVDFQGNAMDNWLFRDMTSQISFYLTLVAAGTICIFWCWLKMRSNSARAQMLSPNRLSNGLIGGGGAAAFGSLKLLFMYLLTGDSVQLWLFAPFFAFGAGLAAAGILMDWRKR
jgi:hypothetical protein